MQESTDTATDASGWQVLGERAPIGMAIIAGAEHRVEYANPSFARLAGSPYTDLRGRTVGDVLQDPAARAVTDLLDRVLESGAALDPVEFSVKSGIDSPHYRLSAWPLDEPHRAIGVVLEPPAAHAAAADAEREAKLIEEIRAINARLVRSAIREEELAEQAQAASRAKSEFLALVSHELRTPLTAVIGYTELLQTGMSGLNDTGSAWAERIRFSAWHLREIVDDLISTVMEEHGAAEPRPEAAAVDVVVRDAVVLVEPSAVEKGLDLRIRAPLPEVTLYTDQRKVRQVLTNILFNAVKFTDAGFVELDAVLMHDAIHFHVRDSGIGIADIDQERIFEPFVQVDASATRRFGGCGLGLGLSRRYAHALGGALTVTSSPGSGSTFTFSLPVRVDPGAAGGDALIRNGSGRRS